MNQHFLYFFFLHKFYHLVIYLRSIQFSGDFIFSYRIFITKRSNNAQLVHRPE
jgi:hypothetical protein